MRIRISRLAALAVLTVVLPPAVAPAIAQDLPRPVKAWSETASVGLTFTDGNKDTSSVNAGYEIVYDPKVRNLMKTDGLFLRSNSDGAVTADRLGVNARDEYRIRDRVFVFGQVQYVRDQFKSIDYLIAPTSGVGYRVVDTPVMKLSFDSGLGGVWEKNPELRLDASGALTYADTFSRQLTATTTFTQSLTGLHKTDDFGDSLHVFNVAIAAALTARTQLKVELLDTYKNHIVETGVVKNDVTVLLALVYKN